MDSTEPFVFAGDALLVVRELEDAALRAYERAIREVALDDRVLRETLVALRCDHARHLTALDGLLGPRPTTTTEACSLGCGGELGTAASLDILRRIELAIHAAYCDAEQGARLAPAAVRVLHASRIDEARQLEFLSDVIELLEEWRVD